MKEETTNKGIQVSATFGLNPCLHITDSHLIKTKEGIRAALEHIHTTQLYKDLQASGYNRTLESEYQEWAAHNVLHRFGIMPKHTSSANIDQNESKVRRLVYAVLSVFL